MKTVAIIAVILLGLVLAPELTLPGLVGWALYEIGGKIK